MNLNTMSKTSILIMSRVPKPGATKTRLTPPLSPQQACKIHEYILQHVASLVGEIPGNHYLFYTGGQADEFRNLVNMSSFTFLQQQGHTLGERMFLAFQHVLNKSVGKALMIGSDIPLVTEAHFVEASAALDTADIVLGPNDDGGYYLIGCKTHHPELFVTHQWGSASVLETTLAVAEKLNLSVHFLKKEIDIDTIDDIHEFITSERLLEMAKHNPKYQHMLDFFKVFVK